MASLYPLGIRSNLARQIVFSFLLSFSPTVSNTVWPISLATVTPEENALSACLHYMLLVFLSIQNLKQYIHSLVFCGFNIKEHLYLHIKVDPK